jgi:serine/threonine protein kinase
MSDTHTLLPSVGDRPTHADPTATRPTLLGPGALVVDRYRLGDVIARGGMGVVYRATDLHFDREVAVKTLLAARPSNHPATARLLVEARITGQLQHPGIPPVFEVGTFPQPAPDPPAAYMVMKLIAGRTLADRLAEDAPKWVRPVVPQRAEGWWGNVVRRGRNVRRWGYRLMTRKLDTGPSESDLTAANPPELAHYLGVFEQICQTVGYAHSRGVIHRDLKPGNVMVGAFGEVQVMDWGLAKRIDDTVPETLADGEEPVGGGLTKHGHVLGTPEYMPPEQARGQIDRIDRRADVFALGAILCHLLTGEPPYSGPRAEVLKRCIAADLGPAFDRLDGSWLDRDLIGLTKRCLAVEPADRPPDGKAVADAVAEYRNTLAAKREAAALRGAAEKASKQERSTALWKIGAFAGACLFIGIKIFPRLPERSEPAPPPTPAVQKDLRAELLRGTLRQNAAAGGQRMADLPDEVLVRLLDGRLKSEDVAFLKLLERRAELAEKEKSATEGKAVKGPPAKIPPAE